MRPFASTLCARLGLGLAGLALAASSAFATTYYVAPTGSDSNPGTSAAPWRTLQKAAAVMVAGDTALIANGDYPGGIVQSRPGASGAPITFRAVNPGGAVVHGDQTPNRDAFVTYAHYVVIDGLTIQQANRAAIRVDNANSVTVRRCFLLNNQTWGLFTDYSDDLLIEYNECAGSRGQHGIYVSNSGDRPVLRYNLVHDNYASGIQINADPAQLEPDYGTRGDGITENAIVEGNVIYNNGVGGAAAINLASVRTSRIVNNLLYNNRAGGIAGWDDEDGIEWGCMGNTILHNTIYFRAGEGRWCVSLKNGSTGNIVQNNILSGGAKGGLELDNDSSLTSNYNLLRSASISAVATNEDTDIFYSLADWRAATGNDQNSSTANPLFVRPTAVPYDFHLQAASPALDSGTNRPDVGIDLDGRARPQNAHWDIGCYEGLPGVLASLTLKPASVRGGSSTTGTVTLTAPAPSGGVLVSLSSGDTTLAQVPATVLVPAEATAVNFTVTTSPVKRARAVTFTRTVTLTATYGVTKTATLTLTR